MAGTVVGGKAAAQTNKQLHGEDFYAKIGSKGGKTKTTKPKGFAAVSPEQRAEAGRKGGTISRRGSKKASQRPAGRNIQPTTDTDDWSNPDWKITIYRTNPFSEAVKGLADTVRKVIK